MGNERDAASSDVALCEIGNLGVRAGGQWSPIRGERSRAAVATLSLHRAGGVSTEALLEAVWPSPSQPATARQSLANLIARLRSAYGDDFIETTGYGYRLGSHVISDRAELLAAVDRASELLGDAPAEALGVVDRAVQLVRGQPWHDVDVPGDVEADRARMHVQVRAAHRIRAMALAELDRYTEAIPELELVLADDPVDEATWYTLARSHASTGSRVDALRALRRARRQLGEHGLTVSDTAAELERRLLIGSTEIAHTTTEFPTTTTPLIGRETLLAELSELLTSESVITLLGPAGVGKTRLAVELAQGASTEERHFVDLSPVLDANRVPSAVTAALEVPVEPGTSPTEALLDAIDTGDMLLVLDNCEQVLEGAAALIAAIAASCPSCSIIATSREGLGITEERIVRVEPLHTGPRDAAVELFFDRVARLGADLPSTAWRTSAAELCRALDGLPLAIELAAARTTILTPAEILAALEDRFRLLRGPDGAGLEEAIRWSWNLLDGEERTALHHLSVFHSGATVDAAASVWRVDRWTALELADRLANKSLLQIRRSLTAPTRLELLDSIRYFVLADAERTGAIRRCLDDHLAWVDALTLRGQGPHGFTGEPGGVDAIDRERHEIRAALDRATSSPEAAARGAMICHRLFGWWRARSAAPEGFERLESLLHTAELTPADRAAATATLASLARIAAVPEHDVRALCIEAERRLDDLAPSDARANIELGLIELRLIEATFDDADPGLGARLRRLAEADLADDCGTALHLLAAWSITNDPDQARAVADEFLTCVSSSADPLDGHPFEFQGLAALVAGDLAEAGQRLGDAIDRHLDLGKTFCAVHCAEAVAWLAIEAGEVEAGRSLLATTEGLRQSSRRSRAGFEEQAITGLLRHLGSLPAPDLEADIAAAIARARSISERLGRSPADVEVR